MDNAGAELVGLKALAWLAGHDELAPVFFGSTGASPDDMRARASDPSFLTAILDFLTMDDQWVKEFCDSQKLSYDDPLHALRHLSQDVHWT